MAYFTIGSTIFTKLKDDATITGYVGTTPVRIYPDIAPLSAAQTFPYITYSVISQTPTNTKGPFDAGDAVVTGPVSQKSPLDIIRIQIDSYTTDYLSGVNLSTKIRDVLDRGIGTGFTLGTGPDIDSIVFEGMSTNYEDKIKPNGVYNFQQEYVIRVLSIPLTLTWQNIFSSAFDGVDAYVDCGDSSVFTFGDGTTDSPFSISSWIRFNSVGSGNTGIIGKDSNSSDREYQIYMTANNLRFRLYDESTGGSITKQLSDLPNASEWYHLCCTYDGSGSNTGMKIYLNSAVPASSSSANGSYTAMENTASPLTIGRVANADVNGNMDEVALFDIELSAAQIVAIYNGGSPTNIAAHTGLVGYWRMGDSEVFPNINDNSSNSNNGTCQNMIASDFQNLIP